MKRATKATANLPCLEERECPVDHVHFVHLVIFTKGAVNKSNVISFCEIIKMPFVPDCKSKSHKNNNKFAMFRTTRMSRGPCSLCPPCHIY